MKYPFIKKFLPFLIPVSIFPWFQKNTELENSIRYDLLFYQQKQEYFYRSTATFKKLDTNMSTGADCVDRQENLSSLESRTESCLPHDISFLRYNGTDIYFTGEGLDLWKLAFVDGVTSKLSEAQRKPVSYNSLQKRTILGFDEKSMFLLYKHALMIQDKDGIKQLPTNFNASEQFFSIASHDNDLYVGTAVHGLYHAHTNKINSDDQAYTGFSPMNAGLPFIPYDENIRFYEEIHALHVTQTGDVIVGTGIQGGVYIKKANEQIFQPLPWPKEWETSDVYLITSGENGDIWVSCTQGLVVFQSSDNSFTMKSYSWSTFALPYKVFLIRDHDDSDLYAYRINQMAKVSPDKIQRMKTASSKRLFYSSVYNLKKNPASVIHLLENSNYDGIVLDVKDDNGRILYNSELPFVRETGALWPVINLSEFVKKVHNLNKYIAVRIVVFKDPVLFDQPGYAIQDINGEKWIGNEKERWIDPFNPALSEKYYAPLLQELTSLGVDEIQFDYIRFPSDGDLSRCVFSYREEGKYFSEALEDFLYNMRMATTLPISLDIYGYQGMYRTGGVIGQDIEILGKYSDIISPMLYSSHFGNEYMTDRKKEDRVYELIRHSMRRAGFIARDRFLIRPYLQAFPMRTAIWGYGDGYFLDQIRASIEQGSGYAFWGSLEQMYAVEHAVDRSKCTAIAGNQEPCL